MSDPAARLNVALKGRYAIERELGEGGMATVYLADDIKHERKVALKVLKPELAAVVGAERFLTEIKTTANPGSHSLSGSAASLLGSLPSTDRIVRLSCRSGPTIKAAGQYPSANISRRGSAAAMINPVSGSRYVIVPSPEA